MLFNSGLTAWVLLAPGGGLAWAGPQQYSSGTERTQVVELYTSEGCSSCPPADAWLAQLEDHPQLWKTIIPLAFHVDYWDYLGWTDPFASTKNSRRQRRLQRAGNIASVYTPGFVINGREWRGFFRGEQRPAAETEKVGALTLSIEGESFSANFVSAVGDRPKDYVLTIALLGMELSNEIKAGENAGRRLAHQFVVLDRREFRSSEPEWAGEFSFYTESAAPKYALVAWLRYGNSLTPVQALGGWFMPENLQILSTE